MDPVPTIEEILQETHSAYRTVFNSATQHRDRYGHVTFTAAVKANLVLRLVKWATDPNQGDSNSEIVDALAKLTVAVYRSA